MMSFSGKTRSSTIFSRSFSIMVNMSQVSSGLGNGTDSLGEDMAVEVKTRAQSERTKVPMMAENLNLVVVQCVRGAEVLRWQIQGRAVVNRGGAEALGRSFSWKDEDDGSHGNENLRETFRNHQVYKGMDTF